MRKPSPALIVALIALFAAMGGTVYAASNINGKTIKKNSMPGNRIKKDTVTGDQVNESSLGIPLAFGHSTGAGTIDSTNSSNLTVTKGDAAGRYCFDVTNGTPRNVQVTVDYNDSPSGARAPQVAIPAASFGCAAGTDFSVQSYGNAGTIANMGLYVLVF